MMPTPDQDADLSKARPRFVPPVFDLEHIFTYHAPPTPYEIDSYVRIRQAALDFATMIVARTPRCADQSAAVRHIREAVMTANAAIALGGRLHKENPPAE